MDMKESLGPAAVFPLVTLVCHMVLRRMRRRHRQGGAA